ncbi:MAG: hypothetical protein K2W84_05905 [Burkholderiales bacterium]|nr:hypothetical protein [Burkholderiales bacterium]
MATGPEFQLLSHVARQWDQIISELGVLRPTAAAVPEQGYELFSVSGEKPLEGSTRLNIAPIALRVPERAKDQRLTLFIAIDGFLYYDTEFFLQHERLRTTKFGTRAAYFRHVDNRYDHVFGVHFDYSENSLSHPVFHAQFKSLNEMFEIVKDRFKVVGDADDCLRNVLGSARVPSAQLDLFSLMIHIFADRMIWQDSTDEEKGAFTRLISFNKNIQGAGHRFAQFENESVQTCMSSRHWYPL